MKKLFAYLAVLIFVVVLAASCNANKKCPAYSISDEQATEVNS